MTTDIQAALDSANANLRSLKNQLRLKTKLMDEAHVLIAKLEKRIASLSSTAHPASNVKEEVCSCGVPFEIHNPTSCGWQNANEVIFPNERYSPAAMSDDEKKLRYAARKIGLTSFPQVSLAIVSESPSFKEGVERKQVDEELIGDAFDKGYLRGVQEAEEKYLGKTGGTALNRASYLSRIASLESTPVNKVWDAAIALANNYCVQISDEYNNDDHIEQADAANRCAKLIREEIGNADRYIPNLSTPKEEGQQWISVETPPKECEDVLAVNQFGRIRVADWESFTNKDLNWFQRTFTLWLPISFLPALPAPADKSENE